jgi:hypothetical protein
MVDWFGTPFTHALHVVERYRLIDYEAARGGQIRGLNADYRGKGLQLHFTVEDEGVFTAPCTAIVTYRRGLGSWPEQVCGENLRATYVTKDSAVPRAVKPDF